VLAVPFAELAGGRLVDVGCNAGYNSIHAAVKYRFSTMGMDVIPRYIEAARFLAGLAGASSESTSFFISGRSITSLTLCSRSHAGLKEEEPN
jgi:hypothetical protein